MERVLLAGAMFAILAVLPAVTEAAPINETAMSSELSAQTRLRPRLRVYPGRLLYRDCRFWLAQEWRPSGIYVVPRQRCWWVRG
jgi:hypothetical protein